MIEKKLQVNMHCVSCAMSIEKTLKKLGCQVSSNPSLKIIKVKYDDKNLTLDEIIKSIKKVGYNATEI